MRSNFVRSIVLAGAIAAVLTATGPVRAQDKIGIAACDEFFVKDEACVAKMPAANQAQFKTQMDAMRTGWKAMAGNEQTKATLEATCTQMTATIKGAMSPFGCAW